MAKSLIHWILVVTLFSSFAPSLQAWILPVREHPQTAGDAQEARLSRLEQQTTDAKASADNA